MNLQSIWKTSCNKLIIRNKIIIIICGKVTNVTDPFHFSFHVSNNGIVLFFALFDQENIGVSSNWKMSRYEKHVKKNYEHSRHCRIGRLCFGRSDSPISKAQINTRRWSCGVRGCPRCLKLNTSSTNPRGNPITTHCPSSTSTIINSHHLGRCKKKIPVF